MEVRRLGDFKDNDKKRKKLQGHPIPYAVP